MTGHRVQVNGHDPRRDTGQVKQTVVFKRGEYLTSNLVKYKDCPTLTGSLTFYAPPVVDSTNNGTVDPVLFLTTGAWRPVSDLVLPSSGCCPGGGLLAQGWHDGVGEATD